MKYIELKNEIKKLSEEQKVTKPQRKRIYFTGKRTLDVSSAERITRQNKYELRHMFYAYACLKGKKEIISNQKMRDNTYMDYYYIEKLINKYKEEVAI